MQLSGQRIVIAGGTGFIGVSLAHHLAALGATVITISRRSATGLPFKHVAWDGRTLGPWASELDGAAALVNLVGRSVDCIKTPDHCDEILRSRVEGTLVLGKACRAVSAPPRVWVQMSTAHIYGDPPEALCNEDSPSGYGLAPTVGYQWEEAFVKSILPVQRGVILRTSFVVGKPNIGGAGALGKLGIVAKLGLGGRVGKGTHGFSWIHEADMNRLIERAITDDSMRGPYNATAPNPVQQVEFMGALRKVAGGLGAMGVGLPAFEWMVRISSRWILRTDPELALYGRFVNSKRLADEGFVFKFPEIGPALADIYRRL
jgi:uncharacterized protein (TIGR01777 family)